MPKFSIIEDEYYPFMDIHEDQRGIYGPLIDIPDERTEWVKRVMKEFDEVQEYLKDLVKPDA